MNAILQKFKFLNFKAHIFYGLKKFLFTVFFVVLHNIIDLITILITHKPQFFSRLKNNLI